MLVPGVVPPGSAPPFPAIGVPGMPMLLTQDHQMLQQLVLQGSPTLSQQQAPATHMCIPSSATEGTIPMGSTQNQERMGPDALSLSSSGEILVHNSNSNNNCHADSRDSLSDGDHQPVTRGNRPPSLLSSLSAPMRIHPLGFSTSVSTHSHMQLSHPISCSTSLSRALSDSQSTFLLNQNPRSAGLVHLNSLPPISGGKSELCLKQSSLSKTCQHLSQRLNRLPDQ